MDFMSQSLHPSAELLERCAKNAYLLLVDIPEAGLYASQADVRQLLAIVKQLEARSELANLMLALRIRRAVDQTLIQEMCRSELHRQKIPVKPPYKVSSVKALSFRQLLDANDFPSTEYLAFVMNQAGTLASYCQAQDIAVTKVRSGQMMVEAPLRIRKKVQSLSNSIEVRPLNKEEMADQLFVEAMLFADDSYAARLLSSIYLKTGQLPADYEGLQSAVADRLKATPSARISAGRRNSPLDVISVMSKYFGRDPDSHRQSILAALLPFISDRSFLPIDIKKRLALIPTGGWLDTQDE